MLKVIEGVVKREAATDTQVSNTLHYIARWQVAYPAKCVLLGEFCVQKPPDQNGHWPFAIPNTTRLTLHLYGIVVHMLQERVDECFHVAMHLRELTSKHRYSNVGSRRQMYVPKPNGGS